MTDWPVFLRELRAEEDRWRHTPADHADSVPWMPFDMARFVMFLTEAVAASPGPAFLDVGCGPGSKVRLATALFDLEAYGIEIDPKMVTRALECGVQAVHADALAWPAYNEADIVYLNRPMQGGSQASLEMQIMDRMAPGAVLISVNALLRPSDFGWETIAAEWDARDGVWKKP